MLYINKMSKFSKDLVEAINKVLPDALKTKIKEQVKLSADAALAAPAATPSTDASTPKEFKTADGVSVFIAVTNDGPVDVNLPVFSDAAGTIPMADGEYTLTDGTTITVSGGIVTEVENKDETSAEAASGVEDSMVNMSAKLSAQKKELEDSFNKKLKEFEVKFNAQSKVIEALKVDNKVLLEMADALVNTPVKEKDFKKEKPYNEMSNHEKALYNRGKI